MPDVELTDTRADAEPTAEQLAALEELFAPVFEHISEVAAKGETIEPDALDAVLGDLIGPEIVAEVREQLDASEARERAEWAAFDAVLGRDQGDGAWSTATAARPRARGRAPRRRRAGGRSRVRSPGRESDPDPPLAPLVALAAAWWAP